MRMLLVGLFVLVFFSVATAGPFPTDDDTPQSTMPPLITH